MKFFVVALLSLFLAGTGEVQAFYPLDVDIKMCDTTPDRTIQMYWSDDQEPITFVVRYFLH